MVGSVHYVQRLFREKCANVTGDFLGFPEILPALLFEKFVIESCAGSQPILGI